MLVATTTRPLSRVPTSVTTWVGSGVPRFYLPLDQVFPQSNVSQFIILSKDLKQHGFKFVGPTTAHALMEAVGVVDTHILSSHRRGCSGLWNTDGTRKREPAR